MHCGTRGSRRPPNIWDRGRLDGWTESAERGGRRVFPVPHIVALAFLRPSSPALHSVFT